MDRPPSTPSRPEAGSSTRRALGAKVGVPQVAFTVVNRAVAQEAIHPTVSPHVDKPFTQSTFAWGSTGLAWYTVCMKEASLASGSGRNTALLVCGVHTSDGVWSALGGDAAPTQVAFTVANRAIAPACLSP